jgi:hypothetical protein
MAKLHRPSSITWAANILELEQPSTGQGAAYRMIKLLYVSNREVRRFDKQVFIFSI